VYINQCGNGRGVVLHSSIISHIVAITNRLLLLTSFFPGKRVLEKYSRLSIPLSARGEEVHFG
jgi:hypothetical protein